MSLVVTPRQNLVSFEAVGPTNLGGEINASGCTSLESLTVENQDITLLNITNCDSLKFLNFNSNLLTSFNFNATLENVNLNDNQLTQIKAANRNNLKYLFANSNNIGTVEVTNCTSLQSLNLNDNNVSILDVSTCTSLESLNVENNQLGGSLTGLGSMSTSLLVSKVISIKNNNMTAQNLNDVFSQLPTKSGSSIFEWSINIHDNLGVCTCDWTIAKNKGWLVYPELYILTSSVDSVNEGVSVTFTLNASKNTGNVAYTISGITSDDIGGASLTGSFVLVNGSASVTFNITNDVLTEGTETMTLSLNGVTCPTSKSVIINDTSLSQTPTPTPTVTNTPTPTPTPTQAQSQNLSNLIVTDDTLSSISSDTNKLLILKPKAQFVPTSENSSYEHLFNIASVTLVSNSYNSVFNNIVLNDTYGDGSQFESTWDENSTSPQAYVVANRTGSLYENSAAWTMYFYYGTFDNALIELSLLLLPDSLSINWDSVFPFTGWKYPNPDYDGTNDEYFSVETTFSVTKKANVDIPNIYDTEMYEIPPYTIGGVVQTPVCHVLDKTLNGFILYLFYNRQDYRRYTSSTNTWSNLQIGNANITRVYNATIYINKLTVISNQGIHTFNGSTWTTQTGDFQSFDMSENENEMGARIINDSGTSSYIWIWDGTNWQSSLTQVCDDKFSNTYLSDEQTVIGQNGTLRKYPCEELTGQDWLTFLSTEIDAAFVLSKPVPVGSDKHYNLFITTNNQNVQNKAIILRGGIKPVSIINLGEYDSLNNVYINKEQWTTGWSDNATGKSLILSKDGKIGYSLNLEKWRVETQLTVNNTWINLRKVS